MRTALEARFYLIIKPPLFFFVFRSVNIQTEHLPVHRFMWQVKSKHDYLFMLKPVLVIHDIFRHKHDLDSS